MDIKRFLKESVIRRAASFYRKNLSRNAFSDRIIKTADFIYEHSQDPSFMMIFFNSVAIISSHLSQMHGLKKSNRENKDFLATQEKKELGLDMLLSVIPPFVLNRFLSKKLASGAWSTESAMDKMMNEVSMVTGAAPSDLFDTSHIVPVKEQIKNFYISCKNFIAKNKHVPPSIREKIKVVHIDKNKIVPVRKFESMLLDFDAVKKGTATNMRNGRALDDLGNSRNGMLIMVAVAYSILSTNILMPIFKNLLTNRTYRKELALKGETPESIRRKNRYSFSEKPVYNTSCGVFSSVDFSAKNSDNSIYYQNLKKVANNQYKTSNNVFSDISKNTLTSLKV